MPLTRYPADRIFVDGENRPLRIDHAYSISGITLDEAIDELLEIHGNKIHLLPFSGASAGAGVFQLDAEDPIIGLHIKPVVSPKVRLADNVEIQSVKLDEIIIDSQQKKVYAGSGINLDQLNRTLCNEVGRQFKVLGADLTSYTYAQVGATFMTGGMGPQRRYFSDSVCEIAIHDGGGLLKVAGDNLKSFAGTYGWTGIVAAVCCDYVELPASEIAFALPVNNSPKALARLLAHLSPYAQLSVDPWSIVSSNAGSELILGLEHITAEAMLPFLNSAENDLTKRAVQLKENCDKAGADGLFFVNGYSDLEVDDFLLRLVDDLDQDTPTIGGIALEHAEIFNNPEQMRAIREGIPYAARMQATPGKYNFKGHTDATVRLNPECVESAMRELWRINQQYVASVEEYFDRHEEVTGEILVYGHMNPVGVDPHNRITFSCDGEEDFVKAEKYLDQRKYEFVRQLAVMCDETGSEFIGGEKSAGSEYEMLPAWEDRRDIPFLLRKKLVRQCRSIQKSSSLFNWRAMEAYRRITF